MTLTEFLLARIEDDVRCASTASQGPWRLDSVAHPEAVIGASGQSVISGGRWGGEAPVFDTDADAHHVARHDPARVLAECAAKRAIVEWATERLMIWEPGGLCDADDRGRWITGAPARLAAVEPALRALALPYADHPGYDEAWRP